METAQPIPTRTLSDSLLAGLEDLWGHIDQLFASLGPQDWSRRHGKDWIYADVPYHLAYFDWEVVVKPIERGLNVPLEEQRVMRSMRELNAWNAEQFAKRPPGQTPEQALEQMRAARDAVRRVATTLSDQDLDRPVWVALPGRGWVTAGMVLGGCHGHTWSEAIQLRLRMNRREPVPSATATHRALNFYMDLFPLLLNRQAAAQGPFTAVMDITGPGGGAWAIQVDQGGCIVAEGRPDRADLVMTQSADTFVKTLNNMHNPMVAMLTRQIRVRGLKNMGRFTKLFPPITPDTVIEPPATGAQTTG